MRLEQRDSYLRRFTTRVRALQEGGGPRPELGDGTWVALEAGAFYPTSGGQPHDTGRLGAAAVTDVSLAGGEVWHRVNGQAPEPGEEVEGVIDWDRRYRHMQRHSAQHLLSQAFVRVSSAFETRSVSLRGPDCTVDLAGEPEDDALHAAETLVNGFAYAAMPVVSFEVDEAELGDYPLRRPPKVRGRIRLVAMGDVEVAACGGTHVANTAETLPIKLLGSERVRGGLRRVTFRAGWEALEDYRARHDLTAGLVQRFSAPLEDLPARIAGLQEELAAARAACSQAQRLRAADVASALARDAAARAGARVVRAVVDDDLLEPVLDVLVAGGEVVALLAARRGEQVRLAFGHGTAAGPDVRPALRAALAVVDGRGGGRPDRAQGAGPRADDVERALDVALDALAQA
ncbi:MAG TPA: DHHA1 domain-containing protein [Trueperaceae bacterium]|nr:DHHA1 domain-containing protein [Trueperaceae bacterium]